MGMKTGVVVFMLFSFFILISSSAQVNPPNLNGAHGTPSANPHREQGVSPPQHRPPPSSRPGNGRQQPISYDSMSKNLPGCNANINGDCGGKYKFDRKCNAYEHYYSMDTTKDKKIQPTPMASSSSSYAAAKPALDWFGLILSLGVVSTNL
ncbi:hypothetical protein L2E82_08262 [Cichorium intybus]|uniref:Uncharacterized protein n=1 Tax=Cichorium intybus TaxID=13427 RepID=A0ACB9G5S5_CICIN|nr:hypothetical protein L2E82_08262 [Cichorium intybus]